MIRRPPRSTRTDNSFPTRRSSDRPDRTRDPRPDPEAKPLSLGKVELGARPDVVIREIRFAGAGVPANVGRAAQRFVGKPASSENPAKPAASMTRAYNRSRVPIFHLAIPDPDLSGASAPPPPARGYVGAGAGS